MSVLNSTNTPLLSLIVPVYNVAPYLRACLDSLQAQTQIVDEIIGIDDGSTDNCPAILAEYGEKMPNLRVIRQENGGLSAARNTGMQHARGTYLAFVDSDDFVAPSMYEELLAMAQRDNLDIAICNATYHYEGRQADELIYLDVKASKVVTGKNWLRERLKNDRLLHMVWMHLYRRDFLVQNNLSFVPRLIHEDVIWTTEALLKAGRIRYTAAPLYFYRIPVRHFAGEQNKKRIEAIIASSVTNAKKLLTFANEGDCDEDLRRLLRWQAVDGAFSIFHKIEKLTDADWCRARYREVSRDGVFPLLWNNAADWRQRRKIARNYLKSLFAGGLHG